MAFRFTISFVVLIFAVSAAAQAKRNSRPSVTTEPPATAQPAPTPTPDRGKKNERPTSNTASRPEVRIEPISAADPNAPLFRYEFTQPDFVVSHIVIEHDAAGRGTIAWKRKNTEQDLIERITVSPVTLEKLNKTFDALDFLDSSEDYQYEKDFSNMGNVEITLRRDGKSRTAKYNWTANKEAKFLMDEYRRIANQYVWMFDFNLARENQPLETPKLVDSLDQLMRRNEIADPQQLLPFLQAVSNDERVPLIGRNHAAKLVKQIEKQKK